MRRILIALAFVALALAGVATAAVVAKKITLRGGQCVTLAKTRVCATPTKTVHAVTTVTGPTVTVTGPTQTVTGPTTTVTVTVTTPTTGGGGGGGTPVNLDFSGDGDKLLEPFTTTVGQHVAWTIHDTCGFGISIWDISSHVAGSTTAAGTSYLPPGPHQFDVIACGTWTIHVGP